MTLVLKLFVKHLLNEEEKGSVSWQFLCDDASRKQPVCAPGGLAVTGPWVKAMRLEFSSSICISVELEDVHGRIAV